MSSADDRRRQEETMGELVGLFNRGEVEDRTTDSDGRVRRDLLARLRRTLRQVHAHNHQVGQQTADSRQTVDGALAYEEGAELEEDLDQGL